MFKGRKTEKDKSIFWSIFQEFSDWSFTANKFLICQRIIKAPANSLWKEVIKSTDSNISHSTLIQLSLFWSLNSTFAPQLKWTYSNSKSLIVEWLKGRILKQFNQNYNLNLTVKPKNFLTFSNNFQELTTQQHQSVQLVPFYA